MGSDISLTVGMKIKVIDKANRELYPDIGKYIRKPDNEETEKLKKEVVKEYKDIIQTIHTVGEQEKALMEMKEKYIDSGVLDEELIIQIFKEEEHKFRKLGSSSTSVDQMKTLVEEEKQEILKSQSQVVGDGSEEAEEGYSKGQFLTLFKKIAQKGHAASVKQGNRTSAGLDRTKSSKQSSNFTDQKIGAIDKSSKNQTSASSISKFFGYSNKSVKNEERALTMKQKVKESIRRGDLNIDPFSIDEEQREEDAGQIIDQIKFNDFLNFYETKNKPIKEGVSPNKE